MLKSEYFGQLIEGVSDFDTSRGNHDPIGRHSELRQLQSKL